MTCLFDRDIAFNCDSTPVGGIGKRVIFINYDDWVNATVTVDGTSNEILTITLAAGGVEGYELQVPKESNIIASEPLRAVDGVDGYDHTVQLQVVTTTQLDRDAIAKLRFNRIVAIIPLNDGRSMLYGAGVDGTPSPVGVGMRVSAHDFLPGDPGFANVQQFTVKTPDSSPPEINLPHIIASSFDIDALLTPTA